MAEFQAAQRFGWDAPARILTTTNLYAGADEMSLPGEPTYPTVLPFVSVSGLQVVGGGMLPVVSEYRDEAERLDMYFHAGNDVTIPLIFKDADLDIDLDMSGAADWEWYAQIRTGRGPSYHLMADFICEAVYAPAELPDQPDGQTTVTLYLPRQSNNYSGKYYWDLKSVQPEALGPDEGDPDPTPGVAHTWLWGEVHVGPMVTVHPNEWPPTSDTPAFPPPVFLTVVTTAGVVVGPNGAVP